MFKNPKFLRFGVGGINKMCEDCGCCEQSEEQPDSFDEE